MGFLYRLQAGVTPDHDDPLRFGALLVEDNFVVKSGGACADQTQASLKISSKVRKQFKIYKKCIHKQLFGLFFRPGVGES